MKFKQFINEESPTLDPKFKEEFEKIGKKVKYKDRYKELFGNKDRIYLKVPGSITIHNEYYEDNENLNARIENYAEQELENLSSEHTFYGEDDNEIKPDFDYEISWKNKSVTFKSPQWKKIGIKSTGLVYDFSELINDHAPSDVRKEFLEMLAAAPKDGKHSNLMVMISRNPCDIGSMSTKTRWTSCMNLYGGGYKHYTREDAKYGTLVVYLIDADDKEAKRPLGRKLIKPYIETSSEKVLLHLTSSVYGEFTEQAVRVVKNWLDEHQKDIVGYFKRHEKLYRDEEGTVYKSPYKVGDRVKLKDENVVARFNFKRQGEDVFYVRTSNGNSYNFPKSFLTFQPKGYTPTDSQVQMMRNIGTTSSVFKFAKMDKVGMIYSIEQSPEDDIDAEVTVKFKHSGSANNQNGWYYIGILVTDIKKG